MIMMTTITMTILMTQKEAVSVYMSTSTCRNDLTFTALILFPYSAGLIYLLFAVRAVGAFCSLHQLSAKLANKTAF